MSQQRRPVDPGLFRKMVEVAMSGEDGPRVAKPVPDTLAGSGYPTDEEAEDMDKPLHASSVDELEDAVRKAGDVFRIIAWTRHSVYTDNPDSVGPRKLEVLRSLEDIERDFAVAIEHLTSFSTAERLYFAEWQRQMSDKSIDFQRAARKKASEDLMRRMAATHPDDLATPEEKLLHAIATAGDNEPETPEDES